MKLIDMSDYAPRARAYWLMLVALGGLSSLWAVVESISYTSEQWIQLLGLTLLVVISCYHPIRQPNSTGSFSAGDCFIFLGTIFLGTPAAIFLAVTDNLVGTLRTTRRAVAIIAAPAIMSLTALVSSQVFYLTLSRLSGVTSYPLGHAPLSIAHLLPPLVFMTFAHYLTNTLLVASLYAVKKRVSVWQQWRTHSMWLSVHFFAAGVAAGIIYEAVVSFGLLYVLLALPVILATYAAYRVYFERVNEKIREAAELARLHLATVEALATAIDAKDQTTHGHVRRLQIYATGMGRLLQLPEREIEALQAGSLLHDVGKLAVPDHILNEPGKLSDADFEKMKMHTVVGAQILERVNFPYPVVPIVRHHHEQWDGGGYPDGLRGEEIPLTARILSVVDCFDSAREERPYRQGLTRTEAIAVLLRGAGTRFDPRVVSLFLQHLTRFEEEIAAQRLDDGLRREEEESQSFAQASPVDARRGGAHGAPAHSYLNQIKDAQREVYAFYQIARTFGTSLNVEDTLSILVNKIGHIVPFETCAVYLYDEQLRQATVTHTAGRNSEALAGQVAVPGKGLLGTVLAERSPLKRRVPHLEFAGIHLSTESPFRSMVAVPLLKGERLLGALVLYSTTLDEYSNDHMRLLETVSRLASDALANAVHNAEMESNALTDALTGLPNARCLDMHFEQEVARARRTGSPFHIIMLDLDDFKQVNDTFGHKTGDRLLREVSQLMKAQLREYDFLARYGGDEFVAVVQGLSHKQAEELCERIEKTVGRFSFGVREDRHARVGLSAGTAVFGTDGETLDQLLNVADEAMYRNKALHKQRPPAEASEEVDSPADELAKNLTSTAIN